jgi:hypothetical protein
LAAHLAVASKKGINVVGLGLFSFVDAKIVLFGCEVDYKDSPGGESSSPGAGSFPRKEYIQSGSLLLARDSRAQQWIIMLIHY